MAKFEKLNAEENNFVDYVLSFYGDAKDSLYGHDKKYIPKPFTKKEVQLATQLRKVLPEVSQFEMGFDSFDREIVRDIVLRLRDPNAIVEHNVNIQGYLLANKLNEELNETPKIAKKPKI